ncbi:MAG: bifunctional isocitrate dehydrogenase kinase/phosphatase [Acidimicrobiia bacterium]|nr:bifunctional isocitrate dehydrogenase kinase/phosphatase [Acidimicrobiia bacterium]
MAPAMTDSRIASMGAELISRFFEEFGTRFRIITRRAPIRFAERDWDGYARDATERLDLYERCVSRAREEIGQHLGSRADDAMVWAGMKAVYSGLIARRDDWELAETFFNSVTRRVLSTEGVDPTIEFVDTDFDTPPTVGTRPLYRSFHSIENIESLVSSVLDMAGIEAPFRSSERDVAATARVVEGHLRAVGALGTVERAEFVPSPFFRGKGAYLVGRIFSGSHVIPMVLCLLHPEGGVTIDAVLLTENQVSILFSFTRSYFHIDTTRPWDLVRFLRSLMPRKRASELYISIGSHKHGKTMLFRELRQHLAGSAERFEMARGVPGLVMVVFTIPGFDVVIKVIKDRFPPPKRITRPQVREKYRMVFRHDRAGRLVDAQTFRHLEFPRERFTDEVIEKLLTECFRTVTVTENNVILAHAYVERRVTPLDLYLERADPRSAGAVVTDYGNAIRDLAATGIFPGDLLPKNFGVTRHGRVVFYDYDELAPLGDLHFRDMPEHDDGLAPGGWFSVGPRDVFPTEFETFLGIQGELRRIYLAHHRDLFDARWWQSVQGRVNDGELIEIYPYQPKARLPGAAGV